MMRWATAALLALALSTLLTQPGWAEDEPQIPIHGRLFVDLNADGEYQGGEPVLGAVVIEFANGERIAAVTTEADGSFALLVEPGLWRAMLQPPEGFEFAVPHGIELELYDPEGGAVDLPIGLQPLEILETLIGALQTDPDQGQSAAAELPPEVDPATVPGVYIGPLVASESPAELTLLPESGGSRPPALTVLLISLGLLGLGAVLRTIGRAVIQRESR